MFIAGDWGRCRIGRPRYTPRRPMPFLRHFPPMGIYETLYAFLRAFGVRWAIAGTHPWSQGFPRTDQLPGGPPMPDAVHVAPEDLKYPKAWGLAGAARGDRRLLPDALRRARSPPTTSWFSPADGRRSSPSCFSSSATSGSGSPRPNTRRTTTCSSGSGGRGRWCRATGERLHAGGRRLSGRAGRISASLVLLSNPCNPTGVTRRGADLRRSSRRPRRRTRGCSIDEAYELFQDGPRARLQYVEDIDASNIFVVGAATKGLQAPGIRIGWVVASKANIEILGNFSSFGMGGVSHPVAALRAGACWSRSASRWSRTAVPAFYREPARSVRRGVREARPAAIHRRRRVLSLVPTAGRPDRRRPEPRGCSRTAPRSSKAPTATWRAAATRRRSRLLPILVRPARAGSFDSDVAILRARAALNRTAGAVRGAQNFGTRRPNRTRRRMM